MVPQSRNLTALIHYIKKEKKKTWHGFGRSIGLTKWKFDIPLCITTFLVLFPGTIQINCMEICSPNTLFFILRQVQKNCKTSWSNLFLWGSIYESVNFMEFASSILGSDSVKIYTGWVERRINIKRKKCFGISHLDNQNESAKGLRTIWITSISDFQNMTDIRRR